MNTFWGSLLLKKTDHVHRAADKSIKINKKTVRPPYDPKQEALLWCTVPMELETFIRQHFSLLCWGMIESFKL